VIANIFSVFLLVVGVVVVVGVFFWYRRDGDRDRFDEDAARAFYDEHGHWPDQTREEALAERRRIAAAGAAGPPPVSHPWEDGTV
jgi:hypothetical protein